MRHLSLILAPLFLLTACATPTTDAPNISKAEMAQEAQLQEAAAQSAPINFDDKKEYSDAEIQALAARLTPIAARVAKAAGTLCHEMHGEKRNCKFGVQLAPKQHGLNAYANGQKVVVYPGMVEFTSNDSQLAFVIAHEFAHNIMGHIAAQKKNVALGSFLGVLGDAAAEAAGVDTDGAIGDVGGKTAMLRYSSSFEAEADYVGLYILARAGFDIEEAPNFWRMMSQAEPNAIFISQTHPNNPARTIAMTKAVDEIRAKQEAHQALIPNVKKKKG